MKYIIAGDGSMPLKEIPDVAAELADPDEALYVCGPNSRYRVGETLLGANSFGTFVVAVPNEDVAADLPPDLQGGADDVVLWDIEAELLSLDPSTVEVLALIPADDQPVDEFLEELIEAALGAGVRCRAMNEQMFEIAIGDDEPQEAPAPAAAPVEDEAPTPEPEDAAEEEEGEVVIPTASEMESMPRAELKILAKKVGAQPADWRSKAAIIDAVLQSASDARGEDPYENSGTDLDALAAEAEALAEPETIRVEGMIVPIPGLTSQIVSEEQARLSAVLSKLLADMVGCINEARAALEDLD